ncbi:MAG: hypothetical protein ACE5DS_00805, partial [Kiloniellaceae bacterium]
WLLATEPELGDPAEALALVESIPRERRLGSPAILDTLAACYAAAGRREEALAVGRRALELARTENKVRLARQIQSHLERIEGGRPLF